MASRVAQLAVHGARRPSHATPPRRWPGGATGSSWRSWPRGRGTWRARRTRCSSALATALADWPASGVPRNPEAWLAVARRKCIDAARRRRSAEQAAGHLRLLAEESEAATERPDERCAVTFVCAHPAIDPAIRAPLLLQILFGFDAAAIASAFRVSPAGMSQRLVRAKKKIRAAGLRLEAPDGPSWPRVATPCGRRSAPPSGVRRLRPRSIERRSDGTGPISS